MNKYWLHLNSCCTSVYHLRKFVNIKPLSAVIPIAQTSRYGAAPSQRLSNRMQINLTPSGHKMGTSSCFTEKLFSDACQDAPIYALH